MATRLIQGVAGGALGLVLLSTVARAQTTDADEEDHALLEMTGAYGFQLGDTEYLPDGSATRHKHPFVTGPGIGFSAGVLLLDELALLANYEYAVAWSRKGNIPGVLDRVRGSISYHTLIAGLRLLPRIGLGRLRAELGVGIIFPYTIELEYDYGDMLSFVGIVGTGTREQNFDLGYGAQGLLGYEIPLGPVMYLATDLKLKAFQSENNGNSTRFRHFVTDFETLPPTAITDTIRHGNGDDNARPETHAVTAIRAQLSLGARF